VPIGRPRRIFRSSLAGLPPVDLRALLVLVAAAVMAGGAFAALSWLRSPAAPSLQAATTQPTIQATVQQELVAPAAQVAVVDGGTLRLKDRVVRLSGVTPPTRGTDCGTGLDCATESANALAALVREDSVACHVTGKDDLGRAFAICEVSGTELNQAVIAAGWARADNGQPALRQAEAQARAQHRGVWATMHGATW
jgi:endonuclease YncB( thermonuclease family)